MALNDSGAGFTGPAAVSFVTANVLANDSDANGDLLSAVLVTPPLHGSVTLNEEVVKQHLLEPNKKAFGMGLTYDEGTPGVCTVAEESAS
jgi:hypothetical protein